MTNLTPERRAELRADAARLRMFRFVIANAPDGYPSGGYEPIDDDITALLDAADERDRLAAQVERVRALAVEYEEHALREGYGGELWSTTAAAICRALNDATDTGDPTC